MHTRTRIAICIAMIVGVAPASFAKDQNARRDQARASAQQSDQFHAFGQAGRGRSGQCWVPTRDDSDEYGADTRGLGYWGSCREKGAVPTK